MQRMGSRSTVPPIYSQMAQVWVSANQHIVQATYILIVHSEKLPASGRSHLSDVPLYMLARPPSLSASETPFPTLNEDSGLYPQVRIPPSMD